MSNRVTGKALKTAALVGLFAGATALSGCTALGSRAFADKTTTGSVGGGNAPMATAQPMPKTLTGPVRVAEGRFIPPNDIGGGGGGYVASANASAGSLPMGSVSTEDLPVLTSSVATESKEMMPAVQPLSPVAVSPQTASLGAPGLVSIPSDAYVHVIESGESLYTIARRYNVTAQAIIQVNGFTSPDKIFVGQKIVIPGRADLLAKMGPAKLVASDDASKAPIEVASIQPNGSTPIAKIGVAEATETPVATSKPLVQPKVEPIMSGADKFRWPVSGRVITDFANSKGTGINIEAAEGAAVRAAENGQVIYVGSGVEGYGNLVLIRHPNGYVSAYAHLQSMSVTKGDVVNRGDNIGLVGKTGSVSKPQLHFELRKGATPVDPVPLLAG